MLIFVSEMFDFLSDSSGSMGFGAFTKVMRLMVGYEYCGAILWCDIPLSAYRGMSSYEAMNTLFFRAEPSTSNALLP